MRRIQSIVRRGIIECQKKGASTGLTSGYLGSMKSMSCNHSVIGPIDIWIGEVEWICEDYGFTQPGDSAAAAA